MVNLTIFVYHKKDDFSFMIINFLFLDGDVPYAPSYYSGISQIVRFSAHAIHFKTVTL